MSAAFDTIPVPKNRVALDPRKIRHRRCRAGVSLNQLATTVAILAQLRGINLDQRGECERLADRTREGRPLILGRRVAELYALALNRDLESLVA